MHDTVPPRPRTGVRTIVIVAVTAAVTAVLVAVAIVVLASRSDSKKTAYVAGSVTITDTDPTQAKFLWDESPARCNGSDAFADVVQGASVVVANENGKTIGVAKLGAGVPGDFEDGGSFGKVARSCKFLVQGGRVPAGKFYRVTVGRQAPVTVSDLGRLDIRVGS